MIIPGFKNYDISTDGVITHASSGRVIKTRVVKDRRNRTYKLVRLINNNGDPKEHNVMSLLALAYLGKPLDVGVVRAKDGNNLNTVLDNVYCTTQSEIAKQLWEGDSFKNRRAKGRCYNDESIELLYETMKLYTEPLTMVELSVALEVPYTTVRYSMAALLDAGKVRRVNRRFEVVR